MNTFKKIASSLFLKIALIGFSIGLLGVLTSAYVHYRLHINTLIDEAARDMEVYGETRVTLLINFFEGQKSRLVYFASDGFMRDTVAKLISQPSDEIREILENHLTSNALPLNKEIDLISILSLDGEILATTSKLYDSDVIEMRKLYSYAIGLAYDDAYVSDFFQDRHSFVVAPLFDRERKSQIGVIISRIRHEAIKLTLFSASQVEKNLALRVNNSPIPLNTVFTNESGVTAITSNGRTFSELIKQFSHSCLISEKKASTRYSYGQNNGSLIGVTCFPAEYHTWSVITVLDKKDLYPSAEPLIRYALWLFFIGWAVFLGTFFLFYIVYSRLIYDTLAVIIAFGKGNTSLRIRTKGNDEIAMVGSAFNSMADSLDAVKAKEQELEKAKSTFLSMATHQLHTPLGSIKWGLELLGSGDCGDLSANGKKLLIQMQASCISLINMVSDLLNISRIEGTRIGKSISTFEIIPIIKLQIDQLKAYLTRKNIKIDLQLPKEKCLTVNIDPQHFQQVLENILANAVKYNKSHGSVTISVVCNEGQVIISIHDTGIGIPKEEQQNIFGKFYRGSNAVKTEVLGSGLGLFIAKVLVESWGGSIWFESEEGKGSSFHFTIPLTH